MDIAKIFKKNILLWLLILLIIPSFLSLVRPGFFSMHDDLQAFRIYEMDKCIKDFQIPCRWVPDAGYQYGYPLFEYYPPSVYYLGEVIHLAGFEFIDSVKILFVLGFILSGLGMYLFLRDFLGKWPGFVGAILYTYSPYKALDVYVRGAMSEFWALVFFPLIFWAIYKLVKTKRLLYLAFLGLFTGLLLITHNLMSFIFLPLAGIWSLSLVFTERKWKALGLLLLGGLLGIGLAAFFILPLSQESQFAHLETLIGGYFDYRQHFVTVNQLFVSNHFGYGSSEYGSGDDLTLSTGQVHFLLVLTGVVLSAVNFKKRKKLFYLTIILMLSALLSLFMTHEKSSFIWDKSEVFSYIQFPWRFLGVSIFLLSIIGAIAVHVIDNRKVSVILGSLAVVMALILQLNFFHPKTWLNISDKDKFSGNLWEKQLTISIFDYLPIYAKFPPVQKALEKPEVLEGEVSFIDYKKGSNYQAGEAVVFKKALIRLPLFDFPGMEVFVDGRKVAHWNDDCRYQAFCLGLITFNLNPGQHKIRAELTNTPIRTAGNTLTIFSIILTTFIFIKYKKNESRIF